MYIVACARCQTRLTDHTFTSYTAADEAAHRLGYPADDSEELWCADCAAECHAPEFDAAREYTRHTV